MARRRFSPLDRVLGRIDDLDAQNLAILARRLERERDLMETVLDTLREGVIVLSHDGAIEYANASAVRLLGVNPDDVAGAELRRLSPDIAQALELPETVGALTRELEVRYPEPRLLTLHLARVGEQHGAERSRRVAVLSDVTKERVQTEDRVESERIDSIVSLAAGVAHEVGNPLAAAFGYAELLDDPDLDDETRADLLSRIQSQLERIREIIRELLDFSRDDAQQPITPTALAPAIREACDLARTAQRARNLPITVTLPDELPAVNAVHSQLVQVLINLLFNAADAMRDARVAAPSVTVSAHTTPDHVILAIRDAGPGVPHDRRTRIFDPFYTTKEPGQGTGLGLPISLRILQRFGGDLRLATPDGQPGACFELVLPLA